MSQGYPNAWRLPGTEAYPTAVPLTDDGYTRRYQSAPPPDPYAAVAPAAPVRQLDADQGDDEPADEVYTDHDQTGSLHVTLGRGGRLLSLKLASSWRQWVLPEYLPTFINATLLAARVSQAQTQPASPPPVIDPRLSPRVAQEEMWQSLRRLQQAASRPPQRPYRIWNERRTVSMRYAQGVLSDLRIESAAVLSAPADVLNTSVYQIIHAADEEERAANGTD